MILVKTLNKTIMTALEFNHQLTRLEDNLIRYAYKLTSNRDSAEDLLQETYLRALTYRDQFADATNLKAWAYTIMRNTFINQYRRNLLANMAFDGAQDFYMLHRLKDNSNMTPDAILFSKEISSRISKLDEPLRIPFQMHLEGYKYQEIADVLNLKIGTVKSRIFFARKRLMEELSEKSLQKKVSI
jgi:RNA polymerase sigma-70 factor (ECF subfamily)